MADTTWTLRNSRSVKQQANVKQLQLAKFREPVSALERNSAADVQLVSREPSTRNGGEPLWRMSVPGRKYEGFKESAGASSGSSSCYVLFKADPKNKVLEVVNVGEWASYRPAISYDTMSAEDAEAAMLASDHRGAKTDARIDKFRKHNDQDDGAASAAPVPGASAFDDEDFDDGAAEDFFGGGADGEEDGREGLDMEDDDLFDDDEDDVGAEDDDRAAEARTEAAKLSAGEAAKLSHFGFETVEDAENEDEGEAAGDEAGDGWSTSTKKLLKEEKRRRRQEEGDDDDFDDDDDDVEEEGAEMLRKLLKEEKPSVEETTDSEVANANGAKPAQGEAGTPASVGGKRKGASPASEDDAKRTRTAAAAAAAPAAAAGSAARATTPPPPGIARGTRQKVQEKDVVNLIHESGRMRLKGLIGHFKGFFVVDKETRGHLTEIIKSVAKLETEGGEKWVLLKDETRHKYNL